MSAESKKSTLDRRDFLKILGTAAGAATLGACVPRALTTAEPTKIESPAVSTSEIVLDFPSWWWGEPGFKDHLEERSRAFEAANPRIKINGYNVSFPVFGDKMLTAVQAGSPPDILHMADSWYGDFLRLGALEPLNGLLETDLKSNWFDLQSQAPFLVDGNYYTVVEMLTNFLPFYNTKLLADAGYPTFPDNVDDFIQAAKDLTKGPAQFGYAFTTIPSDPSNAYFEVAIWTIGYGTHVTTPDGEPNVTDPKFIEALTTLKSLFDADVTPKDVQKNDWRKMWWEGKVAMIIDGSWMHSFAKNEGSTILDIMATAQVPFPSKGVAHGFVNYTIPKDAKHKEEAGKFLDFLMSEESLRLQTERNGVVVARRGAVTEEYLQANPWFRNYVEAAEKHAVLKTPPGREAFTAQIQKVVIDRWNEVLFNDRPVPEAMGDAQKELEDLFA